MLEGIAQIASIISALTAITTSLRALGKSREYTRYEPESMIKTGTRITDINTGKPEIWRKNRFLYLFVTIIWFILSLVFALPALMKTNNLHLLIWVLFFFLTGVFLVFIWYKILVQKNRV
jgi:hypothetical protein